MLRWSIVVAVVVACGATTGPARPRSPIGDGKDTGAPAGVTWKRVETVRDLPGKPAPGTYQIHMIDVGTGLAILVRGADFALLYDAGTNDKEEKPIRVAAYLASTLGPSGDDLCVEKGAPRPTGRVALDHIVLSHPHLDHASMLDLIVHCYDVKNFWDSGRVNDTKFYSELLAAIGKSTALYHTAADVAKDHQVAVKGESIKLPKWERFSEGDRVQLGEGASFTILHAEGKKLQDPNQNSVVIAVELGGTRLLLVGDAESGPRKDPSAPVGDVEEFLIAQHAKDIRADILQVGHHGSKTSSRSKFLEAVKPTLALVSSGPKMYGSVMLPDQEVLDALNAVGAKVLRTDERDGDCPVKDRIGGKSGPGGCDSYVITIGGKPPAQ